MEGEIIKIDNSNPTTWHAGCMKNHGTTPEWLSPKAHNKFQFKRELTLVLQRDEWQRFALYQFPFSIAFHTMVKFIASKAPHLNTACLLNISI